LLNYWRKEVNEWKPKKSNVKRELICIEDDIEELGYMEIVKRLGKIISELENLQNTHIRR